MRENKDIERGIKSFARRKGKAFSHNYARNLEELSPEFEQNPKLLPIPEYQEYCLEIGFGGGEHLFMETKQNPDIFHIGCEPFLDGVVKLMKLAKEHELPNLKIFHDDVNIFLNEVKEQVFNKVFILFPDPWPKAKHNKRRIVSTDFLKMLATKMKPGAKLTMATDDYHYAAQMLEVATATSLFNIPSGSLDFYKKEPANWNKTRYQMKAEEKGIMPCFFEFMLG